jgi:hypothetical protein
MGRGVLRSCAASAAVVVLLAAGTGRATALDVWGLNDQANAASARGDWHTAAADWRVLVAAYARPATRDQAADEAVWYGHLRTAYLHLGEPAAADQAFQREIRYWLQAGDLDTATWDLEQDAQAAAAAHDMTRAVRDWEELLALYAHPKNANQANDEALWWRDIRHWALATHQSSLAQHAFEEELRYFALAGQEDTVVWKLEQQAEESVRQGDLAQAAWDWQHLIPIYAHPANANQANDEALFWRRLGRYYLSIHEDAQAAHAFDEESLYWKLANRTAWGNEDEQRAEVLRPVLDVYLAVSTRGLPRPDLGRFDPGFGTYLGFYVQGDPGIGNDVAAVPARFGRHPAIVLYYLDWGQPLPEGDVAAARTLGSALEIALQPVGGLGQVLADTTYLPALVRACAQAGVPIFLRFAGEMNGAWTAWGMNPDPGQPAFDAHAAEYVAAFRKVAEAMHAGAPNVAMVWSPNDMPQSGTEAYYPGDAYVDWVGVSAYLPRSLLGEPNVNAAGNWLAFLTWIVQHYGSRKPIMVAEGAVTHRDLITGQDVTAWGAEQLTRFFAGLPLRFPQVRAVVYWSSQDLTSDYALADDPAMVQALDAATASPWYLGAVGETSPVAYVPLPATLPAARATLESYVQDGEATWTQVTYAIDGRTVAAATEPPYAATLDLSGLAPGPHTLTVAAVGATGQPVLERTYAFRIG